MFYQMPRKISSRHFLFTSDTNHFISILLQTILNHHSMSLLKAAIIGGGHIADDNHIPALKKLVDQVEIIAVCGRDLGKARALADKHAIEYAFDNTETLYQSCQPDIIVNCTPNNLHYDYTMQALKNGCHVFCEKPPAMTAAEAREMADLAKEKGKILAYNFQRRQSSEYLLLRKCFRGRPARRSLSYQSQPPAPERDTGMGKFHQ
jgi:predicted dehydrogenase